MSRRSIPVVTALALVAGTLSSASLSRADDVTRTETTSPDMREVGGGVVTFGISYGIALGVAATSGHQGDDHLYIPVVGPWLDFGDRGACRGSCDNETVDRAFIVVDGVFQALGALSIVSGLVFQTTHDVATTSTADVTQPSLRIVPIYANGVPGLAAVGRF
jgi:hypothetical protein